MKTGLVLEGGGMRGLYTAGVLDSLLDHRIQADYLVGVSAGACNGVSYISGQRGRNLKVNTNYLRDKRYLSLHNFRTLHSIFGMDFIFDEIPNRLELFDYDAFLQSPCEFVTGVTDVKKGKPVYFDKEDMRYHSTVLRASSSIPLFAPIVEYRGGLYLDGGTSDPIPAQKALDDGCDRLIVVLTRDRAFQKQPELFRSIYRRSFRKYPEMIRVLDERHVVYKAAQELVKRLEDEGKAVVIAPDKPLEIGRFEKDTEKLRGAYRLGYDDTEALIPKIQSLMEEN